MSKRNILTILLAAGICLSAITGLQDIAQNSACGTQSCKIVHLSSFGSLIGIPLSLWGTLGMIIAIIFHAYGKTLLLRYSLSVMLGCEIYFTFIQIYFIQSICFSCLAFFVLLCLCAALTLNKPLDFKIFTTVSLSFLSLHFFFFFPNIELRVELIQPSANNMVEIFSSVSCPHCKEAIAQLKDICSLSNTDLVIRPVPLSNKDYQLTLSYICNHFFKTNTEGAKKFAEKVIWKNRQDLRKLKIDKNSNRSAGDETGLPLIVVNSPYNGRKILRGWNEWSQQTVHHMLLAKTSTAGIDFTGNPTGAICTPQTCRD